VLEGLVTSRQLDEIHDREYTVFLDKDGWAARLPAPQGHLPAGKMPSERDFYRWVNAFWYGAVYVAKQLRRRNLWVAQFRDCTMKELLLQMMEWHARALHGSEYDTFYNGHSLSEWTDAQTWEALHHAFGGFDVAASWEALFQTMDIFRRLATQTALLLGYEYATTLDNRVTLYVQNLRSEMD
jgi:aminoglycoside 6-adenylyltransferase